MGVNLEDVKKYLNIDFGDDDELLLILMKSAIGVIETRTKKKIDQWEEVPAELNQVFLYLISLWYEERIPIGSITNQIAFTLSMLLDPHDMGGLY